MAIAYPLPQASCPAWRRFRAALLITGLAVLVGVGIYGIEKYVLQPRRRFMESPAEVMMRAFGVAHFLVGWLFLFSSPRLYRPAALLRLLFWTLVGVGACFLYGYLDGARAPLVVFAFYALFLVHEVRDESSLARSERAVPEPSAFGDALSLAVTVGLVVLLATLHLGRGWMLDPEHMPAVPAGWLLAALALATSVVVTLFLRSAAVGRREQGSLEAALAAHAPLVRIYQALAVVLFVGSLFGSVGLNLVILIHVSVWLVYVAQRIEQERDGAASRPWFRRSAPGFVALHVGLIVGLLFLFAVRVQVWERVGFISEMLSSSSFPYWSLMHICMAFARRS